MSFLKRIYNWFACLSPVRWFFVCFIVLLIIQVVIYPGVLSTTYIYSEDGAVFLNGAREGITAFATPYGGYLASLSRLIAGLAYLVMLMTNSIIAAGETIEILSAITVALICAYFASDDFSFLIASRFKRLLSVIMLILLMSGFLSMLFNTVDLHWWCGVFIFFVSLRIIHDKKIEKWLIPFIILSILSSPSTFFIILPCFFVLKNHRFKDNKLLVSSVIISFFIQAVFILFVPSLMAQTVETHGIQSIRLDLLFQNVPAILEKVFVSVALSPFFVFGSTFRYALEARLYGPSLFLGVLFWVWLATYCWKNKKWSKEYLLCLFATSMIYAMIYGKNYSIGEDNFFFDFYHSVPAAMLFTMLMIRLSGYLRYRYLSYIVSLGLILVLIISVRPLELYSNDDLVRVDGYVDCSSKEYARITTNLDWFIDVPVKKEYCELFECLREK